MKKYILPIIFIVIIVAGVFIVRFYRQNLRGVRPIISDPAPRDIAPSQTPGQGTNTTGIPLKLPNGFSISIFAESVPGARVLTLDPSGRMLASLTKGGKVVALPDENKDDKADSVTVLAQGLLNPHGLAYVCDGDPETTATNHRCQLFVAEENQVVVYDYDQGTPSISNKKKIMDLPDGGGHYTRTLLVIDTPEGKRLLTSIGSSCNVCVEKDERRAAIYISKLDGTDFKPYATGLRNSVFMTLRLGTDEVWATEMGRDLLGDNTPPDEVNIIKQGHDYGWPYCYGKNTRDNNFSNDKKLRCKESVSQYPTHIDLQAHSAPLGLAFVPEDPASVWPEDMRGDLLVAYHGSWNRSVPTGYKIVRFDLDDQGNVKDTSDFITGFLKADNKSAYGRPVDIVIEPDGVMYISDDHAGLIYRVQYQIN